MAVREFASLSECIALLIHALGKLIAPILGGIRSCIHRSDQPNIANCLDQLNGSAQPRGRKTVATFATVFVFVAISSNCRLY